MSLVAAALLTLSYALPPIPLIPFPPAAPPIMPPPPLAMDTRALMKPPTPTPHPSRARPGPSRTSLATAMQTRKAVITTSPLRLMARPSSAPSSAILGLILLPRAGATSLAMTSPT